MGKVIVVGLGPAGVDLLSARTREFLESGRPGFLRTERHPAAAVLRGFQSFDSVYSSAGSMDEVYDAIVGSLTEAAQSHGEVVYAVPGSPLVAERTVDALRNIAGLDIEVHPALSFLDLAWARLGIDPMQAGVRLIDGHRFSEMAAGLDGPFLVAQCDSQWVLSDVKLALDDDEFIVTVLQGLGTESELVRDVAVHDLDRTVEPDHLTSLWIPRGQAPVAAQLTRFEETVRRLRRECPWDREQTHESLARYAVEEAYEVVEAINWQGDDRDARLSDELGDLLLQVFLNAVIAEERGAFSLSEVVELVDEKMKRRHPHVFGDAVAETAGAVVRSWEDIKAAEKGSKTSALDGLNGALPALNYAESMQKSAAKVGFDWPDSAGPQAKIAEELAEFTAEPSLEELGDLLFSVVNLARHHGLDPEVALRSASVKFATRFRKLEQMAAEQGISLVSADMYGLNRLWETAKKT